jgi:hypothetical protein
MPALRALLQRLQRKPGAVPDRQVRHVDRRDRGCVLRLQPEGSKVADKVGFALSRTRASASTATGCGPGTSPSRLFEEGRSGEKFVAWATSKDYTNLVAEKEGWAERTSGHAHLALCERGLPEGSSFREDDARLRSTRPTRPSRPSSRSPMSASSSWRSLNSRVSARPSASSSRQLLPASDRSTAGAAGAQQLTTREMTKAGYRNKKPPENGGSGSCARPLGRRMPELRRRPIFYPKAALQPSPRKRQDRSSPWQRYTPAPQRADDGALRRASLPLDDRPAGDDDLFLVPELQSADPGHGELRRLLNYEVLPDRSRLLRSAAGTRCCWCSACCSDHRVGGIAWRCCSTSRSSGRASSASWSSRRSSSCRRSRRWCGRTCS